MAPDSAFLVILLILFLAVDLVVFISILVIKWRSRRAFKREKARMLRINRYILDADLAGLGREYASDPLTLLEHIRHLGEFTTLGAAREEAVSAFLASRDLASLAARLLRSPRLHRRIKGYLILGLARKEGIQKRLLAALAREKRSLGRLVCLSQVATLGESPDFPALIACLEKGAPSRRSREIMALAPLATRLREWFDSTELPTGEAALALYLMTVNVRPVEADWDRLAGLASERGDGVGELAAGLLSERFPAQRFLAVFRDRPEPRFRLPMARLLGQTLEPGSLDQLDPWFSDPALREAGIAAAGEILRRHPGSDSVFLSFIGTDSDSPMASAPRAVAPRAGAPRAVALSRALEFRLPALLYHAALPIDPRLRSMMCHLLDQDRVGILVEILSGMSPSGLRLVLLDFLRTELVSRPRAASFLSRHLNSELRTALSLGPPEAEEDRSTIAVKTRDKVYLAVLILAGLAFFPVFFAISRSTELPWLSPAEILYRFLFDFQFLFAYYTLAINGIYLLLLLLSTLRIGSEARLWESDLTRILAGPGILPSISLVVPAYNEEANIVESLNSLLSLSYPSYEIIVINDGSSDATMPALIKAFGLEASGSGSEGILPSMPVRTVYRSPSLPRLRVIDKANGGKADALNAGLNLATGEYFCSIDADSILDPQSLIRAMFQVVASDRDVIAIGGNIFPVNGCVVEHGHLQEIRIPKEPLARFQTIEYLRSFVAGRLGWTLIDGLLIISGAFGLFRRSAVMEVGGYLTGKGAWRRQTVGEDMEIVVRLTRKDRDEGRHGKVEYAYNANCWTEVPEKNRAFWKQRDRWQRGLMEVLALHRGMALRPRYGAPGMISMPYFLFFEHIGPWLETLGYLILIVAVVFSLIDAFIPIVIFGIALAFGILISIASVLLAERQIIYFRPREFLKILSVAVVENFGYRQVTSIGRVVSSFMFFFVARGWGKSRRKGFTTAAAEVAAPAPVDVAPGGAAPGGAAPGAGS
ncbi:MAG: glycosyltransferase [Spirochaetota bacterium]